MVSKSKQKIKNEMAKREEEDEEESNGESTEAASAAEYEQLRAQRIKANMEKMQKLGILELSKTLVKKVSKTTASSSPATKRRQQHTPLPSSPPRRSSRVKNLAPVSYTEKRIKSENKLIKDVKIVIKEGSNPEVYTEDHEKLLGDCKTSWTLCSDGYDEEGHRMYDAYKGKSCHQCRQKTLGHRTRCSKCTSVRGQFCGDCLFMRYGENVLEANEDPSWICPVCRGICNCSRCRKEKGWEPTGLIYKKVRKLGFQSVAHYLIQTRRGTNQEEPVDVAAEHIQVEEIDEGEESDFEYEGGNYDGDEGEGNEGLDEDCIDTDDK